MDSKDLQTPPRAENHIEDGKRKVYKPQKTPVHCSNSIVVEFQLIDGTPMPSLQIKTTGSRWYLKARRRLFSQSDSKWTIKDDALDYKADCEPSLSNATADFVPGTNEEDEVYGSSLTEKRQSSLYKGKVCASCKTKKTPLWRDSEDGTPYCNACGIRFKKYRICCPICSYIPRKDEKIGNVCCHCGSSLFHYNKTQ